MCPRCHSNDLHRSRRWHPKDWLMRLWGLKAFRCEQCLFRFYLPPNMAKAVRADRAWVHSVDHPHAKRQNRKPG